MPMAEQASGRVQERAPGARALPRLQAAARALAERLAPRVPQPPQRPRRVAVVQSDIVSSTFLLEAAGRDYPRLLLRHRALIASAVERRGGRFLSHAGDGTLAVFDRAGNALLASVEAQRALGAERWPEGLVPRVRMGLHVGEVFEIDGEPVGLVINHGARIMAAAGPGQVMVSTAAAEAASREGVTETGRLAVGDAGWHALRDHAEPVRLGQVVAEGLTVVAPDDGGSATGNAGSPPSAWADAGHAGFAAC